MRFERLTIHNFSEHRDIDLDLSAVPGRIVAVTGRNGAGKTTALELMSGGAIYRHCPSRGALDELANERDASLEVVVHNGERYTIRQTCDSHTRKSKTVIRGADGEPVVSSTGVTVNDKWLAEHFPPAEVLFASAFAVQTKRGLFDLNRTERVAAFSRALGLERFERLAKAAADRAKTAAAELATLRARVAEIGAPEMPALRVAVADAEAALAKARQATSDARAGLERARAAAVDLERARELAERRKAAEERLRVATEQRENVERRIANNRALLAQAGEIRAAEKSAAALDEQAVAARAELATITRSNDKAKAEHRAAMERQGAARKEADRVAGLVRELDRRIVGADKARAAKAKLEHWEIEQEPESSESAVSWLEAEVARLEQLAHDAKNTRIAGLRHGLVAIADCRDDDAPLQSWAAHTIATDDELADAEGDPAGAIRRKRDALARDREALRVLLANVAAAKVEAAKLAAIEIAERDLAAARAEHAELAAALAKHDQAVGWAHAVASDGWAQVQASERELARITGERNDLAPLLGKVEHLERAETLIEERTAQLPPLVATIEEAEREIARLPAGEPEAVDLAVSEKRVAGAEAAEAAATGTLARARGAVERGEEAHRKTRALHDEIRTVEREHGDWKRLALELGRQGLQAMELDAAFPEMTACANDLLHKCHGSRFTVEFIGYRMSADGRSAIEDPDVRVIDTEKGRDALARTYSGGELVFVGEAVSLALMMATCRRFGLERPTIVRDESGAALDREHKPAWMNMLRRAADVLDADKVLVVTHDREIVRMTDTELYFGRGGIETHSPDREMPEEDAAEPAEKEKVAA